MSTTTSSSTKAAEAQITEAQSSTRLRRLNSSTSSTYSNTTLPPYTSTTSLTPLTDTKNPFLSPLDNSDTSSITSSTPDTSSSNRKFIPTSALRIDAQGKKRISFPSPSKELEIGVESLEVDSYGSVISPSTTTSIESKYLSIRPKRSSGSCTLVLTSNPEVSLSSTKYFFGPGNPPKMTVFNPSNSSSNNDEGSEFTLECKSLVSRTTIFTHPKYGKFSWRYAGKKEKNLLGSPVPYNVMVLEKIVPRPGTGKDGKEVEERICVARLVRSDETRTPGSRSSSAGNGGVLEMCLSPPAWSHVGSGGDGIDVDFKVGLNGNREGEELIDEVTVLTTCLVMLKKEIDRLRGIQILVLSGGIGGGV